MTDPVVREKTFIDWTLKSPIAEEVAKSGFVRMLSMKDTLKCVYCGVSLYKWEEGDDPFEDHRFNSPFCSFILYKEQQQQDKTDRRGDISAPQDQDVTGAHDFSHKVTLGDLSNLCRA
jgi:hypothetical protein